MILKEDHFYMLSLRYALAYRNVHSQEAAKNASIVS